MVVPNFKWEYLRLYDCANKYIGLEYSCKHIREYDTLYHRYLTSWTALRTAVYIIKKIQLCIYKTAFGGRVRSITTYDKQWLYCQPVGKYFRVDQHCGCCCLFTEWRPQLILRTWPKLEFGSPIVNQCLLAFTLRVEETGIGWDQKGLGRELLESQCWSSLWFGKSFRGRENSRVTYNGLMSMPNNVKYPKRLTNNLRPKDDPAASWSLWQRFMTILIHSTCIH